MKMKNILCVVIALLLLPKVNAQSLDITNRFLEKIGDSIVVRFDVEVGRISSNYKLTMTPVLWQGDKYHSLKQILVQGKNSRRADLRAGVKPIDAIKGNSKGMTSYSCSIPFEVWMSGVSFKLDIEKKGCCEVELLPSIYIFSNRLQPVLLPISPIFDQNAKALYISNISKQISNACPFIYPISSYNQLSNSKANSIAIYFNQGSSKIIRKFKDNTISLNKIKTGISFISDNPQIKLSKIVVMGSSSPEGSYKFNERLAKLRINNLISYTKDVDTNLYEIHNLGEDWDGLVELVKDSEMEYKEEVLHIIDNYSIFGGREKILMNLASGAPYRYMLKTFFPALRNASYIQLFYELTSNKEIEILEQVILMIKEEKYSESLDILQKLEPTAYVSNLMGVCYMMLNDVVNARKYLEKAIIEGNEDAIKNLEKLNYQQNNITYK